MVQPHEESSTSQPPPFVRPAYNPPQYLLSSSGLSRNEIVAQYEAFTQGLELIQIAPELVFERMFGNLQAVFNGALIREQANHGAAKEAWCREKTALQADLDRAPLPAKQTATLSLPSGPVVVAVAPPVPAISNQTYLQFWYSSSIGTRSSAAGVSVRVHVAATMVPIPYGLASGWAGMDTIRTSADYGTYDTRTDALLSSSTLPATITHIVHFKKSFPSPPDVMVWLTGLSAARHDKVCVKVMANNLTESEFTLQISSAGGATLGSAGAAWAVWSPTPGSGQTTGSVNTVAPAAARVKNLNTTGKLPVKGVKFLALSAMDLVIGERLSIDVEMVQDRDTSYLPQGSTWKMSAGPVSASVYSARVVYTSR